MKSVTRRIAKLEDQLGAAQGGFGIVYLYEIPDGLNAQELEMYLRKDYAETHGFRCAR